MVDGAAPTAWASSEGAFATLTRVDATAESTRVEPTRPALARLRHQVRIVVVIASSEFKLKYAGSALGYIWSVLKPLGLFGMLYVVFGRFLSLGNGIPHYPLYLLLGIVLWTFFFDATTLGMQSVVERSTLISKLAFPRVIIPLSVTVSSAITLCVNLVAIAVLIGINRIVPEPRWLLMLPLLLELYLVALGITLVLSTLYVRFRDVGQVWELVLLILFYASPILYPAARLPHWFREITFLNPFVQIMQDARAIVVPSSATLTAAHVYGAGGELVPLAVVALLFVGGYLLFRRQEPWFAERA
jgi:ABC-2 type transport system permease protein